MKKAMFFLAVVVLFASCYREYSAKGFEATKDTTKLSKDYPFASGYCNSIRLDTLYPPNTDVAATITTGTLPVSVLLNMPPAGDQGHQGSCAAWAAIYAAGSYTNHLQTGKAYNDSTVLSPSYAYNQITKGDCTCTCIIDNLNILKYQGASPLSSMPYSDAECSRQPNTAQKTAAINFKINKWAIIQRGSLTITKRLLYEKHVIIIVVHVSANFQQLQYPYVWNEQQPAVGELHALAVAGYDDNKNAFRLMNSWGERWADKGFAWMDYRFFEMNTAPECYVVF